MHTWRIDGTPLTEKEINGWVAKLQKRELWLRYFSYVWLFTMICVWLPLAYWDVVPGLPTLLLNALPAKLIDFTGDGTLFPMAVFFSVYIATFILTVMVPIAVVNSYTMAIHKFRPILLEHCEKAIELCQKHAALEQYRVAVLECRERLTEGEYQAMLVFDEAMDRQNIENERLSKPQAACDTLHSKTLSWSGLKRGQS